MTYRAQPLEVMLSQVDQVIPPRPGDLPESLFRFVSRRTPLVNVDLLIQRNLESRRETLLTWRQDEFYLGWHVPGGIVRFKESFRERIDAVAKQELGATVKAQSSPAGVFNMINSSRSTRGHFIALLFRCTLLSEPSDSMRCPNVDCPSPGQWAWHSMPPVKMLAQQAIYRSFLESQ